LTQPVEKRPPGGAKKKVGEPETGRSVRSEDRLGNMMVLATIGSVVIAVAIRIGVLSPLLFTAAVFPFFYRVLRRSDHRTGMALVFRWGVTLFVTLLVMGAFVPNRLGAALPFSTDAVRTVEAWIQEPNAPPPADLGYLLWGMLAFLAASVASGGLLGFVLGAVALGQAAFGAIFVFRHGFNVIQIALVALPVWQLSALVAAAFFLVPASVLMFPRFFHVESHVEDWQRLRRYMYSGAGFFALSILLRVAVAGALRALVVRWTIF
jgi:hypothetical protein